jgi:hypothetical protein
VRSNFNLNLGVRYEYVTIPNTLRLQGLNTIASVLVQGGGTPPDGTSGHHHD